MSYDENKLRELVKSGNYSEISRYISDNNSYSNPLGNLILVYGSLRQGEYNYDRIKRICGADSLMYIDDNLVPYYELYDLGEYPAIVPSNKHNELKVELMFMDKIASTYIDNMEVSAGYVPTYASIFLKLAGNASKVIRVRIYVASKDLAAYIDSSNAPLIESGDWLKHLYSATAEKE